MDAAVDRHGADWRQWIFTNIERGCTPASMVASMINSVWTLDQAAAALDEALALASKASQWRTALPTIRSGDRITLSDGQVVSVLARLRQPKAVLLDGLLSAAECHALMEYAFDKGMSRSGVVEGSTGDSVDHHARTSSTTFMTRAETPLVDRIERRMAELTGWPVSHGEGLQILRYEAGQQYRPHFDWFDPAKPGSAVHLTRGGQRLGTTVIYLSAPEAGGGTCFPAAGIDVLPPVGGAIFFQDVDALGVPDPKSLHGGLPVERGIKMVATYWQREGPFGPPQDAVG
jgi:prolyl 4-hydroxylase